MTEASPDGDGRPRPAPRVALASAMELLERCLLASSAEEVVDLALDVAGAGWSASQARERTRRWTAGGADPVHDVVAESRLVDQLFSGEGGTARELVASAAERYADLLEPTFSLWDDCASFAASLGEPTLLLLRDALQFWPFVAARGMEVRFLAYTRRHERENRSPTVLVRSDSWKSHAADTSPRCTLLDTGIYGTLVASLLQRGYFNECPVVFLTTRNPSILGRSNARIDALVRAGRDIDPHDAIRLCDTAESMMKPFGFVGEDEGGPIVELGDPVSLACAGEALRRARIHAATSPGELDDDSWADALGALSSEGTWFRRTTVPPWDEGVAFVDSWTLGPLPPLRRPADLLVRKGQR